MRNGFDPIGVVEEAYRLDLDSGAWLQAIGAQAVSQLDRGLGVVALTFRISPGWIPSLRSLEVIRGDSRLADACAQMIATAPRYANRIFAPGFGVRFASEFLATSDRDFVRRGSKDVGATDSLNLTASNPDGDGVILSAPLREPTMVPSAEKRMWRMVASHIAAGARLRASLADHASVEATSTPDGRIVDAEGIAKEPSALAALRDAVRAREKARGPLRRRDGVGMLAMWRGLVSGRWSLLDRFESDGRRFVVARRNDLRIDNPRALSRAERVAVAYAAAGLTNAAIAYLTGWSSSTVATHLGRGLHKLGIGSRAELAGLYGGLLTSRAGRQRVGTEWLAVASSPQPGHDVSVLSPTELEVAQELASGARVADVALRRGTSVHTVTNQVTAIYRKLHVRRRVDLAARLAQVATTRAERPG